MRMEMTKKSKASRRKDLAGRLESRVKARRQASWVTTVCRRRTPEFGKIL